MKAIDTRYENANAICDTCGRGPKDVVRFTHPVGDPDEREINVCTRCLQIADSVMRQRKPWVMDADGDAYLEETIG
jgi:NMD protein affecting ribosome stability and mRNA decay